jgi:DedD protein
MANEPTAEQVEVRRKGRQRLIGAVALALAAVVFVPMVLDPEPKRERAEPLLAIPPKDGAPPLAEAGKPPEAPPSAPAAAPSPESKPPAAAASAPERGVVEPRSAEFASASPRAAAPKAPPPAAGTGPKPEPKAQPPAPKLEGFAVQVGAFRDEAKLAHAREKVAGARLPHYTERLDSGAGELTRLRAGPFPTREAAEKAASQLKRAGLDARVVPLP